MKKSSDRASTVLVATYGVLAFAAIGRSTYELFFKFEQAPLPYLLSTFSALVYLVATIALARNSVMSRKYAWISISIELVGVLAVGSLSLLNPALFEFAGKPVHTVWSYFGVGYGFIPVALPIIGLVWLGRQRMKSI